MGKANTQSYMSTARCGASGISRYCVYSSLHLPPYLSVVLSRDVV